MANILLEPTYIFCDDLRVDGVIFLYAVQRVCLCSPDDLLRVVQEEHAEQDQASVDGH